MLISSHHNNGEVYQRQADVMKHHHRIIADILLETGHKRELLHRRVVIDETLVGGPDVINQVSCAYQYIGICQPVTANNGNMFRSINKKSR